ncbi:Hypothetical protein SRAE_2000393200 [Strongyloides ratti]|uniref:Uncharacterized protein n=1 Tax=Strongyloides ratti TaxID=34506 RepID=A0A090LHR7_STRRB|nr:Hypothetical protein SRAE_2000393200 [Strongyloides ratti]CEF69282.1 Hypothetical protein SRAE_2000393200 [Strongyloides ratti]
MLGRRYMNHLACKFVKSPVVLVHVVDPYLNLNKRGIKNIDVDKIEKEYKLWWDFFLKMKNIEEKDEVKKFNIELKSLSSGLVGALSLPNDIEKFDDLDSVKIPSNEPSSILSHIPKLKMMGMCRSDSKHGYLHILGYPVRLQDEIKEKLSNILHTYHPVSPPYMIRQAVIEGCNMDVEELLSFTETGNDMGMYLMGVSLPTILSKYIKTKFLSEKNKWPIIIRSEGVSYKKPKMTKYLNLFNSCQKEVIGIVVFGRDSEECEKGSEEVVDLVIKEINDNMGLSVEKNTVSNNMLKMYEQAAVQYLNSQLSPKPELIRVSKIGSYISERLNIVYEDAELSFVHMNYINIDISSILGSILEKNFDVNENESLDN